MRKLFLLAITCIGFTALLGAQDIAQNAIGLRLGDSDAYGAEISYQRALNDTNRLEFGLGWRNGNRYDVVKLVGLYQWVWALDGSFNWYAGGGGGFNSFSGINRFGVDSNDTSFIVAGDVGIEYSFDIPLQLSLDFRPEVGNNDFNKKNLVFDIGFGVRYQF